MDGLADRVEVSVDASEKEAGDRLNSRMPVFYTTDPWQSSADGIPQAIFTLLCQSIGRWIVWKNPVSVDRVLTG